MKIESFDNISIQMHLHFQNVLALHNNNLKICKPEILLKVSVVILIFYNQSSRIKAKTKH